MRAQELIDAELTTLYNKVVELERERDAAVELAETATMKLQQARAAKEHYQQLWKVEHDTRRRLEKGGFKNWLRRFL